MLGRLFEKLGLLEPPPWFIVAFWSLEVLFALVLVIALLRLFEMYGILAP